ncbi:MAG: type II toxin-antitoxin system prevent-host-death family antitoxin [Planctomycetes bacterium]|nr:type II toxin-antitoxin system prevent-host-death family antitoxin [Planctomycetota bacterium]
MRDLQNTIRTCVEQAQRERIVVTRSGKPAAVLIGVEVANWEVLATGADLSFWCMIEKRRRERTVSLATLRRRRLLPARRPAARFP